MRGAQKTYYEYIFELHTEQKSVGCDGRHHVNGVKVSMVPDEADNVSCL